MFIHDMSAINHKYTHSLQMIWSHMKKSLSTSKMNIKQPPFFASLPVHSNVVESIQMHWMHSNAFVLDSKLVQKFPK